MSQRTKEILIALTLMTVGLTISGVSVVQLSASHDRHADPEAVQTSKRKAMEDSIPIILNGSYYEGEPVELNNPSVSKEEAVEAVIDRYLNDNEVLQTIPEVRPMLERENRAQTAMMTGSYRGSDDEWIAYVDRETWVVELTSVPIGGAASCGPLIGNQCLPPGRAPYYTGLVDAHTGEVYTVRNQGLPGPDPIWDGVVKQVYDIYDQRREAYWQAVENGEIEPPPTATPAPYWP